jgi:hypothetical protein
MLSIPSDTIKKLRIPGYCVMAMLSCLPIIELIATAIPTQFHVPTWRLSLVGTAGAAGVASILGLFFVFAIAVAADDRGVLWTVSSVCGVAAVLCFGAAALFPLDVLQVKSQVNPATMARYGAASAIAMLKISLTGVVATVLAVSSYRAASRGRPEAIRGRAVAGSPLVIGQAPSRTGTTNN